MDKITRWWLDMFMVLPALMKVEAIFGDDSYIFWVHYNLIYDEEVGLLVQYIRNKRKNPENESIKKNNGEKILWTSQSSLKKDKLSHMQKLSSKSSIRGFPKFKKDIINTIVSLQQKNGLWRANLF